MPFLNRKPDVQRVTDLEATVAAINEAQAIVWLDPDGVILEANENFLATFGYPRDAIVDQHDRMFVTRGQAETAEYKALWENLRRGEPQGAELDCQNANGQAIYLNASFVPIVSPEGSVTKIACFATDQTENKSAQLQAEGQVHAISRSQAVIEFELDGTIITANENFLNALGYSLQEVKGKHHSIFVDPEYAASEEYKGFWRDLAEGKYNSAEFKRITKSGKEIWIQASYNPILGPDGKPIKVIKYATDVTAAKLAAADHEGQVNAVSRAQAVIEFELDGTIRTANDNFLQAVGYDLGEIVGKHHSIFVDPDYAESEEFQQFWRDLAQGKVQAAEYNRFTKDGREIWLQATYNPIFNPDGKPYKVVKFATDITPMKQELQLVIERLTALSQGDLTQRLPEAGQSEFADMRNAFNATLDKLGELVGDINFASASIKEESDAIADSANDLSARCERQAATVEETSASMEEMSSTVKSNAENAKNATAAAKSASEHAERGGEIVKDAIAAMEKIEDGSAEVRKIIEVIDAIAFQTNLLALNAGVEAARAGEAGSGFAVVASEVRALAQRASESARDISQLIETSERQVAEGAGLVKKTGEALTEIVTSVSVVSGGIDEIFTASNEQAAGVGEINQAMAEIDSTTQKTAAISEESTAAAASLAQRSNSLRELVGYFRTGAQSQTRVHRNESERVVAETDDVVDVLQVEPDPLPEPSKVPPAVSGQLALDHHEDPDDWREF